MLFTNACIFLPEGRFQRGCFRVENGRFTQVGEEVSAEGIDLQGALVLPGLVDIHTHGCAGADFSDGDLPGLKRMGRFYAAHGVTAFCPTSMSLPYERLREAFLTAGNIRPELVWIMLLAFVLTMVGMITGAVTMRRRDAQPFFPVMGIFVNFLLFAGILAIYALGF